MLIIGCGNRLRGDDGVGLELAQRLAERLEGRATVLGFEGEPVGLPDLWRGFGRVALIDAAKSGAAPGTLHRFEVSEHPLPARTFTGSGHAFALAAALELARALGRLPCELTVFGVEGSSFDLGAGLSDLLVTALPDLVHHIMVDLGSTIPAERTA